MADKQEIQSKYSLFFYDVFEIFMTAIESKKESILNANIPFPEITEYQFFNVLFRLEGKNRSVFYSWLKGSRKLSDTAIKDYIRCFYNIYDSDSANTDLSSIIDSLIKPYNDYSVIDDIVSEIEIRVIEILCERVRNETAIKVNSFADAISLHFVHYLCSTLFQMCRKLPDEEHFIQRQQEINKIKNLLSTQEVIFIFGPKSSGKSTIMLAVCRDTGVITWNYSAEPEFDSFINSLSFSEDKFFSYINQYRKSIKKIQFPDKLTRLRYLSVPHTLIVENFNASDTYTLQKIMDFNRETGIKVLIETYILPASNYAGVYIPLMSAEQLESIFWNYNSSYRTPELESMVKKLPVAAENLSILVSLISEHFSQMCKIGNKQAAYHALSIILKQKGGNLRQNIQNNLTYRSEFDNTQINLIGHIYKLFGSDLTAEEKDALLLLSCLDGYYIPEYFIQKWFFGNLDILDSLLKKGWCEQNNDLIFVRIPKFVTIHLFKSTDAEKRQLDSIFTFMKHFLNEIENEGIECIKLSLVHTVLSSMFDFLSERIQTFGLKKQKLQLQIFRLKSILFFITYCYPDGAWELYKKEIEGFSLNPILDCALRLSISLVMQDEKNANYSQMESFINFLSESKNKSYNKLTLTEKILFLDLLIEILIKYYVHLSSCLCECIYNFVCFGNNLNLNLMCGISSTLKITDKLLSGFERLAAECPKYPIHGALLRDIHEYLHNEVILLLQYSSITIKRDKNIDFISKLIKISDEIYSSVKETILHSPVSRRESLHQIYQYAIGTYVSASSVIMLNWQKSLIPEHFNIWNNALKKQTEHMDILHYRLNYLSFLSSNFMPFPAMVACRISNDLYNLVKQCYTKT